MAYNRQAFVNNKTVLTAEMLGHIEDGIVANETSITALSTLLTEVQKTLKEIAGKTATARIGNITLLADRWAGNASPYSQVVTVEGATKNSQIDITPSVEQLAIFHEKDLAFVTENENGVVTVYAVGQKPENDYTIQVTITEVAV